MTSLSSMVKGDASIVKRLALQFLEAAQLALSEVETALRHHDIQTLHAIGHRIKYTARTIGAFEFVDLCAQLENIDSTTALTKSTKILSDMQDQLEKLNADIFTQLQNFPLFETKEV